MKVYEKYHINEDPLFNRELLTQVLAKADGIDLTIRQFLTNLAPKHRNKLLNIGVGVEIEVENAERFPSRFWQTEGDGSLRDNGLEFKTIYGHRIFHAYNSLKDFSDTVISKPEFYRFSERTSVHVHLDVRNFTEEHLNRLFLLYTLFEAPLFNFAGTERRENIFCVPFRESILCKKSTNLWAFVEQGSKYCALNTRTIPGFGTVEFRHMVGNADHNYIFTWILLLGSLLYAAQTSTHEDLVNVIADMKTRSNYYQFKTIVFRELGDLLEISPSEFDVAISDAKLLITKG